MPVNSSYEQKAHEKLNIHIEPSFNSSRCFFPFTDCQSPRVDAPHLLSQLRLPKESTADFGSPSDVKICNELEALSLAGFDNYQSPSIPELSTSPTESVISTGVLNTLPRAIPSRHQSVSNHSSGYADPNEFGSSLRRVKTVASAYPHLKLRSRRVASNTHKPISAKSYFSLPTSDAVTFLSSFAESSAIDMASNAPDEEGEEVGEYVMGKVIGSGAFSTVREAYTLDPKDGSLIRLAVKVIQKDDKLESQKTEERIMALQDEVAVWKQLHHPHLLRFIELIDTDYAEFVFMELCPHGSLLDLLMEKTKLTESEARVYFLQLAEALRYLHQDAHIIHCDLKLENLVLATKDSLRLSDFGLSQPLHRSPSKSPPSPSGSIAYCSPELLSSPPSSNSFQSDIWSLGVILFAMVSGKFPFSDGYEPRLVMKIRSGQFSMPSEFSPSLSQLLSQMLHLNPDSRPSISDVLDSAWCQAT